MTSNDLVTLIQRLIDGHEFLSWLDIEVDHVSTGTVVLTLPSRSTFTNQFRGSNGSIHGGIVATVIDCSSAFALRSTFANPETATMATTDLNVSYVRPAQGDLRVEAEVVYAGGSIGVTRASVTPVGADGEPVAVGSTTYRLFRDG